MAERAVDRLLTPGRVFGALGVLILLVILLVPWPDADEGPALSSYSAVPAGGRGLYEVLERLGFRTERRLVPLREAVSSDPVYLVLGAPVGYTAVEAHRLLEAVRGGAGLFVIPEPGTRLADSLGLTWAVELPRRDSLGMQRIGPGWVRQVLRRVDDDRVSDDRYEPPDEATTFLTIETDEGVEPVIVGLPMGRGRLVVAADPELFRNSEVRLGAPAERVVRLVEWLQDGDAARRIVFDEYHHGYGTHADPAAVARRALVTTPAGRTVLQVGCAVLVLLLALGVRPIRPRPRIRIERRSPLEHVGALARAYGAVNAEQRAAHLLVRGLLRRHGGLRAGRDEAAYLHSIAERKPGVAGEVEQVLRARTDGPVMPIAELGTAIQRIERAITT
jgi:hypothetical protein